MSKPESGDVFRALADPTRRGIVTLLRRGALPVRRISERFEMSRPAVSKHLRILSRAGLVRAEQRGRENHYAADLGPLSTVRAWLDGGTEPRRSKPGGRAERGEGPVEPEGGTAGWQVW